MFVLERGTYVSETNSFSLPEPLLLGLSPRGKELLESLEDERRKDLWEYTKFWIPVTISVIALLYSHLALYIAVFRQ